MGVGGEIRIGASGWSYPSWRGTFYPDDLRPEAWLGCYAERLGTVEVNATFYRLPEPAAVAAWRDATPPGFVFAVKASRFITHMKKLKDPEASTPSFLRAARLLGDKLGPVLFQLPPRWRVNADRLRRFLQALPRDVRVAFEFRDESWFTTEVYAQLERAGAALCLYDLDRRRSPLVVTAPFVYVRLHGPDGPYRGRYDGRTLAGWARRFSSWRDAGLDVYCYFDNDEAGYAPQDALRLTAMIAARRPR